MIIYGWNSKNIKQGDLETYQCPNCGEKQSVMAIFAHYVHIFWIPLFPFKKSARIVCNHCQLNTEEKTMPEEMRGTIDKLKSTVGIPKSLFSGLLILIVAIGFFSLGSAKKRKLEQSYIENPQIGDVYVLQDPNETSEYNHYLMKINEIEEDSFLVSFSAYSYNGVVSKLDPADGFYNIEYAMHKNNLNQIQESGEVKKVIRDYSSAAGFDRVIEYQEFDSEFDTLNVE